MPQLGASSSGLELARESGHKITPPLPAMAPLCLSEVWIKSLSGISLPDALLSLTCGNTSQKSRGTLLFTHDGVSGMAALNLAGTAYRMWSAKPDKLKITLNFLADKSTADYAQMLTSFQKEMPDKLLKTSLSHFLPKSLAAGICAAAGVENRQNRDLKVSEKENFIRSLSAMPLTIERLCPVEKAMAMSGGIHLKEVDPETMGSRLVRGLFFAGEILDLTGPCGGFNIQFALSSGYLAGTSSLC